MDIPGSQASPTPSKFPELTGVRGLAACGVFLFHIWVTAGSRPINFGAAVGFDLTPIFAGGWVGVDLFFVLSGFVLTWPYLRQKKFQFRFRDFIRRRLLRVVPAYYVQFTILAVLALAGVLGDFPSVSNVIAHLLFLHNFNFDWSGTLNGAWWTLPVEWQFYLVFPVLLFFISRFGIARTLPWIVLIVLSWRIGAMAWINAYDSGASIGKKVWLLEQLPGRIDQFFIGMSAAWMTFHAWPRLSNSFRNRLSLGLIAFGFGLTILMLFILWPRVQVYWRGHWLLYVWHLLVAFALATFVAGLALGGRFGRLLMGNRLMLGLGEIAYSVYLWNYIVLVALVSHGAFAGLGEKELLWRVGLYSLGPVLLVSSLSWWAAERPFLHYRDQHPAYRTNGFLARMIRSPWQGVVATSVALIGGVAIAHAYLRPGEAILAQCSARGWVDSPSNIRGAPDGVVRIAGWVYDWDPTDRIRRVVLTVGGQDVAESIPNRERHDVVAALRGCRVDKPGFEILLQGSRLPANTTKLTVFAERNSGRRFRIGDIARNQ